MVNALDSIQDEDDGEDGDGGGGSSSGGGGDVLRSSRIQSQADVHESRNEVTSISLIGERHSSTNWITDHLQKCFGKDLVVSIFCASSRQNRKE